MPFYSFHCSRCSEDFEALMSISATELPACPACGTTEVERLPSAPAIGGRTKSLTQQARSMAAKEGHFSNYSKSELKGKV